MWSVARYVVLFTITCYRLTIWQDFVKWEEWSIHDNGDSFSIKGAVAQLVACIGPELAKEVVVSFSG